MNKIDLIIDNIEYAKLVTEQAHKDELLEKALAAARELQTLAQPEQEPKLSDAGVDTNIPLWGLEPKGSGMVTLHQPEQDWDLLKATQESLREHMARIKELEAQPKLTCATTQRAEAVAKKLRNRDSWDGLDRETVFAIDALVAYAKSLINHADTAKQEPYFCKDCGKGLLGKEHIHTCSPQVKRQWVGLTEDEMFIALKNLDNNTKRLPNGFKRFADAITLLLKNKNT